MRLKTFRIVTAAVLFVACSLIFLVDSPLTRTISLGITSLQLIPSLLEFSVGNRWALGFVVVILLTLVWGRVYCSFLCPLGILQDLAGRCAKLVPPPKRRKIQKFTVTKAAYWSWLRYSIFTLTAASLVSGSLLFVTLLDPYAIFGRIMSDVVRPVVGLGYNTVVRWLEDCRIYAISPMLIVTASTWAIILTLAVGLGIGAWAFLRGRAYCNTICPVGTLLSLVARLSYWKLRLSDRCTHCGWCASQCKSGGIDLDRRHIAFGDCVMCFNCLSACSGHRIEFVKPASATNCRPLLNQTNDQSPQPASATDLSRRQCLATFCSTGAGLLSAWVPLTWQKQTEVQRIGQRGLYRAILPPGGISFAHFSSSCNGCHLCVVYCPSKVLQPAVLEYGISGMLQPVLNFNKSFCEYECNACTQVCPTGALIKTSLEQKKQIQLGIAQIVEKNCVVYAKKKDCSACAEHCPTHAVYSEPYEKNLYAPKVKTDLCTGCGICQFACPVTPKAIVVKGHLVHAQAIKLEPKTAPVSKNSGSDEFPF